MQTNFFQQLADLKAEGTFTLVIKTGLHDRMLGTFHFTNDKVNDVASKQIPTLNLRGTVEGFDKTFFDEIRKPIQITTGLITNMEQYEKAQEEAKQHSKMEQDKQQQEKKNKESGNKKYDALMKKVSELEEAGKFREAYGQLPKVAEFPEQEAAIHEKKEALTAKFDQPSLF